VQGGREALPVTVTGFEWHSPEKMDLFSSRGDVIQIDAGDVSIKRGDTGETLSVRNAAALAAATAAEENAFGSATRRRHLLSFAGALATSGTFVMMAPSMPPSPPPNYRKCGAGEFAVWQKNYCLLYSYGFLPNPVHGIHMMPKLKEYKSWAITGVGSFTCVDSGQTVACEKAYNGNTFYGSREEHCKYGFDKVAKVYVPTGDLAGQDADASSKPECDISTWMFDMWTSRDYPGQGYMYSGPIPLEAPSGWTDECKNYYNYQYQAYGKTINEHKTCIDNIPPEPPLFGLMGSDFRRHLQNFGGPLMNTDENIAKQVKHCGARPVVPKQDSGEAIKMGMCERACAGKLMEAKTGIPYMQNPIGQFISYGDWIGGFPGFIGAWQNNIGDTKEEAPDCDKALISDYMMAHEYGSLYQRLNPRTSPA